MESELATLLSKIEHAIFESEDGELEIELLFGAQIARIGRVDFLTQVFKQYSSGTLKAYLLNCAFVWNRLTYSEYQSLLSNISGAYKCLFDFIVFSGEFLAIDVKRVIDSNSNVDVVCVRYVAENFPNQTPSPNRIFAENFLEDRGVDYKSLWNRLASEGAPIKALE